MVSSDLNNDGNQSNDKETNSAKKIKIENFQNDSMSDDDTRHDSEKKVRFKNDQNHGMPNDSTTDNSTKNDGIPDECATAPTDNTARAKRPCNAPHTRPPNPTPDYGSDDSSDDDDDDDTSASSDKTVFNFLPKMSLHPF